MWAAVYGNDDAVKELLKAGADKSLKDEDGKTARDWAIKNNRTRVVEVLR
jgi:ankyrin repeat protein